MKLFNGNKSRMTPQNNEQTPLAFQNNEDVQPPTSLGADTVNQRLDPRAQVEMTVIIRNLFSLRAETQ